LYLRIEAASTKKLGAFWKWITKSQKNDDKPVFTVSMRHVVKGKGWAAYCIGPLRANDDRTYLLKRAKTLVPSDWSVRIVDKIQ
jgi:hypothetical protein